MMKDTIEENSGKFLKKIWKVTEIPKQVQKKIVRSLSSITWIKKGKWKSLGRVWLFVTPWTVWYSPGQNTGVGSRSLLQRIFSTQGSIPGLPHCRWILYQLSHKGSPRILEWIAYPFSSGSSQPRNRTKVSCIAGGFFTNWAIREVLDWKT